MNVNVKIVERKPEDVPVEEVFRFVDSPEVAMLLLILAEVSPGALMTSVVARLVGAAVALNYRVEVTPCEN